MTTLAACHGGAPAGPAPAAFSASTREALDEAARSTAPNQRVVVRISWRSDDGRMQLSGSGAARIAPPDSLRADIAAALGLGRATVILTGDSAVSQPPAVIDQVLPDRFALWAALGVLRPPAGIVTVERLEDGTRVVWRVTDRSGRATIFETAAGALSMVSRQREGRTISTMRLTRDPDGAVRKASITDLERSLRLEIEITGRESSGAFAPETWSLRP